MEEYAIEVAPSEEEYERIGETAIEDNQLGMTWFNTGYKSEPYVHLIAELAEFYGCHPVFKRGELNRVRIYGRESARITCCVMFKFLLKECEKLAVDWSNTYGWTKRDSKIEIVSAMGAYVQDLVSSSSPLKSHVPALIRPLDEARSLDVSTTGTFYTSVSASDDAIEKAGKVSLSPQVRKVARKKKAISSSRS